MVFFTRLKNMNSYEFEFSQAVKEIRGQVLDVVVRQVKVTKVSEKFEVRLTKRQEVFGKI